jgi:TRAP-type C4-dicarboxylate transport system substrate-binding protein
VELIKALGILPEQRLWSDAYLGLQSGKIDELVTTPFLCLAGQFDRNAKHYLPLNYVPLAGATIISKKVWDSLTADQREVMHRAALEAGKQIQASSRADNEKSIEAMKNRGLQVHPMTPEAEKEWEKYFEAVYPQVRGKLVPADIFDEVQGVLAEYRSAMPQAQRGRGK